MHLNQQRHASNGYAATANAFTWRRMFEQVGYFREDLLNCGDRVAKTQEGSKVPAQVVSQKVKEMVRLGSLVVSVQLFMSTCSLFK